jgi:sigma-E factor negative regulatory protein RseC
MIEENAYVVRLESAHSPPEPSYAWIETERKSSCGHCAGKSSCGTQVLSKVLGKRNNQFKVLNESHAKKGDLVLIAIDDTILLSGSFLLYFVPLLTMILSSFLATVLSQQLNYLTDQIDTISIIFALLGFITGVAYVRFNIKKMTQINKNHYQARIIKILSTNAIPNS